MLFVCAGAKEWGKKPYGRLISVGWKSNKYFSVSRTWGTSTFLLYMTNQGFFPQYPLMRIFSQSFCPAHLAINYGLQSKCLHLQLLNLAWNPVSKMFIWIWKPHQHLAKHIWKWQNGGGQGEGREMFNVSFDVYSCIPSSGPHIKGARKIRLADR